MEKKSSKDPIFTFSERLKGTEWVDRYLATDAGTLLDTSESKGVSIPKDAHLTWIDDTCPPIDEDFYENIPKVLRYLNSINDFDEDIWE